MVLYSHHAHPRTVHILAASLLAPSTSYCERHRSQPFFANPHKKKQCNAMFFYRLEPVIVSYDAYVFLRNVTAPSKFANTNSQLPHLPQLKHHQQGVHRRWSKIKITEAVHHFGQLQVNTANTANDTQAGASRHDPAPNRQRLRADLPLICPLILSLIHI